ncbi:site-specific integrase [Micromonospora chersina]|uniref:hypothetical protein n=1 Tax=Micromonospora chersina TaxID=47854 RepID=UPI0037196EB1
MRRDGSPLRGNTLYRAFVRARKQVGLDDLTFHDLRHTGQTFAAQTAASGGAAPPIPPQPVEATGTPRSGQLPLDRAWG